MAFNEFQLQAIETKNKDILVSAGAGSGKTSVMIERIVRNIIAGEVNVNQLLVVTFTNAAASEMRLKLEKALNEKLASVDLNEAQNKRLREQLELLGQSDICTLHKFCQTIIQKYFYTIDLDPSFAIGEESETAVLRTRAMNELLKECEDKKDANFMLLANTFDDKRNFEKIKNYVYKIYNFLTNQPDIQDFKSRIDLSYQGDLDNNALSKIINQYCIEMFDYFYKVFFEFKRDAEMIGYNEMIEYLTTFLNSLSCVKSTNTFTQNHFAVFNLPKIADLRIKTYSPETEDLKEKVGEVKKKFSDKLKELKEKIYISSDLHTLEQDLHDTKQVLDAMLFLVDKFTNKYLKIKKDRNILDFSDLEHYAHKILQQENVRLELSNRYKQIFVDEYQDINDIQENIISSVHKKRDLFLVGDIKQSIYGFRGTNPQIFLEKQQSFGDKHNDENVAIDLNYNYRTDQKILDLVNWVFGALMTKTLGDIDYLPDNEMVSGIEFESNKTSLPQVSIEIINKEKKESEPLIPTVVYRVSDAPIKEDEEDALARSEGAIIAQRIAELMTNQKQIYDAKNKTFRDITYSDITLLCGTRSKAVSIIHDTLMEYGIPVSPISQESVFEQYEVQVLFAYLNLVNNIYDDISLTTFLTSPIINLDEDSLACVRACAPERVNYYECVFDYLDKKDEISNKLTYAINLIQEGGEHLQNDSIYNLLNYLCTKTNYYSLIGSMQDGQNRVKNVRGYINSFIGRKYNTDLSEYISSVEQAEDKPAIAPEQTVGANVVSIETMHESKGLEYPIVFLIDTGHGFNRDSTKGDFLLHSNLGVGVWKYDSVYRTKTPTISVSAIKIAIKNKEFAENLRLLYVAMTRAKNHLFITGCCETKNLVANTSPFAVKMRNNFIELILSAFDKEKIDLLANGCDHIEYQLSINNKAIINVFPMAENIKEKLSDAKKKQILGDIDAKTLDILAKNYNYTYKYGKSTTTALKNTVTALNRESEAEESINLQPKQFSIAENTSLSAISTEQGIAYHKAMQLIDFDLPDVESVRLFLLSKMSPYEMELIDCEKIFSAILNIKPLLNGARIYREQQFLMLENYNALVKNSTLEDEILVQGVIDLIIVKNNEIYLVDYKTSASHNVEKTAQNYIMQLNCYSKAIEGALGAKVSKKFLYFFLQERLILIDN